MVSSWSLAITPWDRASTVFLPILQMRKRKWRHRELKEFAQGCQLPKPMLFPSHHSVFHFSGSVHLFALPEFLFKNTWMETFLNWMHQPINSPCEQSAILGFWRENNTPKYFLFSPQGFWFVQWTFFGLHSGCRALFSYGPGSHCS